MLDPDLNYVPENVKKIHLVSACGTGMGALCAMLKEAGFEISGSDQGIYPPMSTFLEEKGITLYNGYSGDNIGDDIDLVIIGNAVSRDNLEACEVLKRKLNYISMPQAINHFFGKNKKVLMVTGTHGKTTTTGMISWILESSGLKPSFFIGGIHKNFNSGFKIDEGEYLVIEGDEYDTAFFDKDSKFHHFSPHRLVVTGIEFDHADIFNSIDEIKDSFSRLLNRKGLNSKVFAYDSSLHLKEIIDGAGGENIYFYGKNKDSDIGFTNPLTESGITKFSYNGKFHKGKISLPMSGDHNIYNALAAASLCLSLGLDFDEVAKGLKTYKGMKRRQELRGEVNGIKIIDDFAHHPTEVLFTIDGIKKSYSPKRLITVFEPRTNTSMRDVFQKEYENSFDNSDLILIRKPSKLNKIPANQRFSSEILVEKLKNKGLMALYFDTTDGIIDFLLKESKEDDLILIMSNGGFDNIHERLLLELQA